MQGKSISGSVVRCETPHPRGRSSYKGCQTTDLLNIRRLHCEVESPLAEMATAEKTQEEVRKGLSRLAGVGGKSSKNLPAHAHDPTQPGNPDTKRTDQIFAEEAGRTSMLWNPFLNRGSRALLYAHPDHHIIFRSARKGA